MTDDEIWKLGWRMVESAMDENSEMAELQFDSLLKFAQKVDMKMLIKGLDIKSEQGKNDEIVKILSAQSQDFLNEICKRPFATNLEPCIDVSKEQVENKNLQIELIKMYVDDQAVRGNVMTAMLSKYNLDSLLITKDHGVEVDARNRDRLKEIFSEYGFPSRKLIGKDAMRGIFLMIQHSDGDTEWQKSQLGNIKEAVENGDLDGQSYAYLYDRIMVNNGGKQRYGTQFSNVYPIKNIVELAHVEDAENLDTRRREIGMMPIAMYKRVMLKQLQK